MCGIQWKKRAKIWHGSRKEIIWRITLNIDDPIMRGVKFLATGYIEQTESLTI